MAEAEGKLTGRPGICFVSRGPGACNASIGIHAARQDSTPLVMFVGQVGSRDLGREAFQEIDVERTFAPLAKATMRLEDAARTVEIVSGAAHLAMSGRPGPVVVSLPEDRLALPSAKPDIRGFQVPLASPAPDTLAALRRILEPAAKPLVIVGGSQWSDRARADLEAVAAQLTLPVAAAFRRADRIDNDHPCYVGDLGLGANPELLAYAHESDCVIALGCRLNEATTGGYGWLSPPRPQQTLVHVYPDANELGRLYQPDLPVPASAAAMVAAIRTALTAEWSDMTHHRWEGWRERGRAVYERWQVPPPSPGAVNLAEIVLWLRQRLPPDAIVTNGAGNYAGWISRYYRFRRFPTQLAPTVGAMGYGVPSAVAAKLACPQRAVVSVSGDGCFLMNGQELATAVANDLPIVFLVINNGIYGTIRMHQEMAFPGRPIATSIPGTDFAALARAYGAHGQTVRETRDFAPAFEQALTVGGPALIDVKVNPDAISTTTTLTKISARSK